MQTIKGLWNGNIAPCEHYGPHDAQANQLIGLIKLHRETLCGGLTALQMETFQKYKDCSEEYLLRMMELSFCDGFCLASKLLTEALSEN